MDNMLVDGLIVAPCVLGLIWSVKECLHLKGVKIDGHPGLLVKADALGEGNSQAIVGSMKRIAGKSED
jgi:hypothetical protein